MTALPVPPGFEEIPPGADRYAASLGPYYRRKDGERYVFGFRGNTLVTGALGGGCVRCLATAIEPYIASIGNLIDVDGNGAVDPLTDTLLVLRYAFGFRGDALVTGAVGGQCKRCAASQIEAYLACGDRRAARRQYERYLKQHGEASPEITQIARKHRL